MALRSLCSLLLPLLALAAYQASPYRTVSRDYGVTVIARNPSVVWTLPANSDAALTWGLLPQLYSDGGWAWSPETTHL